MSGTERVPERLLIAIHTAGLLVLRRDAAFLQVAP
jgi:hypothetical protein